MHVHWKFIFAIAYFHENKAEMASGLMASSSTMNHGVNGIALLILESVKCWGVELSNSRKRYIFD